jgi:rare lipoprotein A (peptidoglycan hydrolase)
MVKLKRDGILVLGGLLVLMACSTTGSVRRELDKPSVRRQYDTRARSENVIYGEASFYGAEFQGKKTASGEVFDMNGLTAAHLELPFGTLCRVTNLTNQKEVIVRVNDRGPFVKNRVMDLSYGAAKELDAVASGVIEVKIEVLSYGDDEQLKK